MAQDRWPGEIITDEATLNAAATGVAGGASPTGLAEPALDVEAPPVDGASDTEEWEPFVGQTLTFAKDGPGAMIDQAATDAANIGIDAYRVTEDGRVAFRLQDGSIKEYPMYELADGERYAQEYRARYGSEPPLAADVSEGGEENIDALRERDLLPDELDAFVRGGALGLDDEIDAIVGSVVYGGSFADNLKRSRAIRDYDEKNHPWARAGGAIASSLLLPTKVGEVASPAARNAMRDALAAGLGREQARAIAQQAARRAIRGQMTKEGAMYGAAVGAADGDTAVDRGIGAVKGGVAGAVASGSLAAAGTGASRVVPRLTSRPVPTERQLFEQAAERQDVDYLLADRPKAFGSQLSTALTGSTLGAIPLAEGAEKTIASLAAARSRVAGKMGNARDEVGAGQALQRGVKSFIADDSKVATLYNAIPIPAGAPASLANTRGKLQEITSGFTSNSALSKVWSDDPKLQATLNALSEGAETGTLSWGDLKAFRSIIGQKIGKPSLTSDGVEIDRLRALYGSLSEDMRATASGMGAGALRAFERANTYARARNGRIENTLKDILGDTYQNSAEDSLKTLMSWGKGPGGDFASTARLFRSLDDQSASTIRASLFDLMGKAPKGSQDATQEVFSPAVFMTHWSGLSERAKNILFQGEHRKAIDDIVRLASGMKASSKFANTSKTGLAVGGASSIAGLVGNPAMGALYLAGQFGAGKLLGSPKFARWLASFGKKPNQPAAVAHVKRLSAIARAEPTIANDILGLQQRLIESFSGSAPARIAADESGNGALGVPPDQGNNSQGYPGEELPQ